MISSRNSRSLVRMALTRSPKLPGNNSVAVATTRHQRRHQQFFSSQPVRGTNVSPAERAALRAARKERATKVIEQQKNAGVEGATAATAEGATSTAAALSSQTSSGSSRPNLALSRYIWYLSVGVPSVLLVWGFSDEKSPPARFCRAIGLTDFVSSYTEEIAKPAHNKLLPDWSQVRTQPQVVCLPRSMPTDDASSRHGSFRQR